MRRYTLPALLLTGVCLLAGCSQQNVEDKQATRDASVAAAAKKKEAARERKIGETGALCTKLVAPFTDKLHDLNSRLGVGLKQDDYGQRLGDIRVAYDATKWDTTPNAYCLRQVGVPLETAMNDYTKAGTIWGDCLENYMSCDMDAEATPKMQSRWTHAATMIDKSARNLQDFQLDE